MLRDIEEFTYTLVDLWYNTEEDLDDFLDKCETVSLLCTREAKVELSAFTISSTGWTCDIDLGEYGNLDLIAPDGKEVARLLFDSKEGCIDQLTVALRNNKIVKAYKEELRKLLSDIYKLWVSEALTEESLGVLLDGANVVVESEVDFKKPVAIGTAIEIMLTTQLYPVRVAITDYYVLKVQLKIKHRPLPL